MTGCEASACDTGQGANPLLVLLFCPYCFASGLFGLLTTGLVSTPAVLGVPVEHILAPLIVFGSLALWIGWGAWVKRGAANPSRDAGATSADREPSAL